MRKPARGEANDIDEQGQSPAIMTLRDVNIDGALRRVAKQVPLEDTAFDTKPGHTPRGMRRKFSHQVFPLDPS
jgi:hypothetical protein